MRIVFPRAKVVKERTGEADICKGSVPKALFCNTDQAILYCHHGIQGKRTFKNLRKKDQIIFGKGRTNFGKGLSICGKGM